MPGTSVVAGAGFFAGAGAVSWPKLFEAMAGIGFTVVAGTQVAATWENKLREREKTLAGVLARVLLFIRPIRLSSCPPNEATLHKLCDITDALNDSLIPFQGPACSPTRTSAAPLRDQDAEITSDSDPADVAEQVLHVYEETYTKLTSVGGMAWLACDFDGVVSSLDDVIRPALSEDGTTRCRVALEKQKLYASFQRGHFIAQMIAIRDEANAVLEKVLKDLRQPRAGLTAP